MDSTLVRPARKEDMSEIFNMIKELAVFENMPEQVKIHPDTLIADGFGPNPAFGCYVAHPQTDETKVIGYALYYYCYSTWVGKSIFLEDLFVLPEYRKHGTGKKLFMAVAKHANDSSKRLDFHVLSWNPATKFYKSLGCTNLTQKEEWNMYRLDKDDLTKLFTN